MSTASGSSAAGRGTSGSAPRSGGAQARPSGSATSGNTATAQRAAAQGPTRAAEDAYTQELNDPRRVKLTVNRVNIFSALKISFLLSVGLGIAFVILTLVLWIILNGMGVFSSINDTLSEVTTSAQGSRLSIADYLSLPKVLSGAIVISVIDVVLLTAIGTLLAVIYNLCAALVGGLRVTLSDE